MNLPFIHRVSFVEKLLFTKHLSVMLKSGITISEAINTLILQTKSQTFRRILNDILHQIENGHTFHDSLSRHGEVFDEFYTSLIEVSEESGTLDETLEFLAKQLGKEYALRKKIQGALLYPGLVLSVTTILGGFIAFFILPRLAGFFREFEVELPLATKILIGTAEIIKTYNIFLLFGIVGLVVFWSFFIRLSFVKPIWHSFLLRLPLVGNIISYNELARFSRNLGTLITSGVPVVKSLETTAHTLSNIIYQRDLKYIAAEVSRGKSISDILDQAQFQEFPPVAVKIIGVGEKTGRLDEMALYLADFYEEEIDEVSKNLTTILEPVLLLVIGLVVAFVALAIISPIYQITGSLNR